MTREQFKKCVREVEAVWELSGKLSDVGIETIDCKELSYASDILAEWIEDSFGPEGKDLVSWWMYEDTVNARRRPVSRKGCRFFYLQRAEKWIYYLERKNFLNIYCKKRRMQKRRQNYGIKFPFTKENNDEVFLDLNQNFVDKAKSDMFHAIFTPKGQRLRLPDFGTNLIQFIFEENTSRTWDKIREEISTVTEKYVPTVKVTDVLVYTECDDDHTAYVTLKFTVTNGIFITDEQELTIKL